MVLMFRFAALSIHLFALGWLYCGQLSLPNILQLNLQYFEVANATEDSLSHIHTRASQKSHAEPVSPMVWPWGLSETVEKESNTLLHVHPFDADNSAKLNCLGRTFNPMNHICCNFCLLLVFRSRKTLGCFPSLKLTLVGLAQEATSINYRATMETPRNDNLFNNCSLFLHQPCCSIRWLMSSFSTNAASCFSF